jgi:2-polyprenyl-6-hydroxyphenyl methylase / 3-demethylubiquinone-9 3-methyltransferase
MANATVTGTIRASEAAHFGKLAADWWDPKGSSAMLHKLGPVRLGFIRDAIDRHWQGDARSVRPLTGKRALDLGCGAGLLCEPLARLGAAVTGIDAAEENVAAAQAHAAGSGLAVDYRCGDVAELELKDFDLVTSMEVIEHVADKPSFIAALANALKPDGLMILSTPNRTPASRLLLVEGAEQLGMIPRGTHHWDHFITPDELGELLSDAGLAMGKPQGIAWSPMKGLHLSDDLALNYIVSATWKNPA